MMRGVSREVFLSQSQQCESRAFSLLLNMHERARKLNQTFVKRAIGSVADLQPELFQNLMSLEKLAAVEQRKEPGIARMQRF